jgi:hypothetical protein
MMKIGRYSCFCESESLHGHLRQTDPLMPAPLQPWQKYELSANMRIGALFAA